MALAKWIAASGDENALGTGRNNRQFFIPPIRSMQIMQIFESRDMSHAHKQTTHILPCQLASREYGSFLDLLS